MTHLSVRDLSVVFRDAAGAEVPAVRGVSFDLARGETLGIVGESGSGKSTVARSLLGFARPGARFAAGSVHLGETSVLDLAPSEMRAFRGARAAMVPQNPLSSLTPHMTNGAQLAELVRLHGGLKGHQAKARALDLMAATGMPEPKALYDRYPHEISGGQRQRLVIAAALVARPDLIVLDEPTTALDKTVEAKVLDLVRQVQQDLGATLVYVSHDLNVISAMCQRVLVMKSGEILEDGPTAQVFDQPRTAYARRLIDAIPRLGAEPRQAGRQPKAGSLLQVNGIGFDYRRPRGLLRRPQTGRRAVDGVSFTLHQGETLGIVGESGSGKSTLAGILAGIYAGYQGEIRLGAEAVTGPARTRSKDLRRRIQMVFQDPLSSLNPAQTIEEILTRPLRHYFNLTQAEARSQAIEVLAQMELGGEVLSRRPRQLSGGQQQRIAIARALTAKPDVMLLDEITSALDVTIQAEVLALLHRLQAARGIGMILISHDLAVVAQVSDRVLVLEHGLVRDFDTCARVFSAPTHPYTARLLAAYRRAEAPQTPPLPARELAKATL